MGQIEIKKSTKNYMLFNRFAVMLTQDNKVIRRRIFLISIISILIIVTVVIIYPLESKTPTLRNTSEAKPGNVGKIEYILVKSAFFNETKILKPNAALLLTNKKEIFEDQELFLADQEYAHTCGYDYSIQFWKDSDSLSHKVDLNSKCEIFSYKPSEAKERLDYYKRKLETTPTHYIYNLKLSVLTEPAKVKAIFINSGMKLFFIDDASNRFPSINFSYRQDTLVGEFANDHSWEIAEKENKEKSEKIINTIIEKVKGVASVVKQSDIFYNSYGRSNKYMTHNGQVNLKFQNGTNLTKVSDVITKEGAVVDYANNPESYYVQLVDTSANLEKVKTKVKKYKIINDVSEYPK